MTGGEPRAGSASLGRHWAPLVTVVPYVLLAGLTGVIAAVGWDDPALPVDLALCALTAAWILALFTLHPPWRRARG